MSRFGGYRVVSHTHTQVLHHWQKKGVEFAEYPYARFNTKLERVTYTDDEYERLLADLHWTRSDTDYLINLCHRLDLRWPVILDRYAPVPPRPLEQLQRRYYHCAHALARDRYRRSRGGRLESEGGVPAYVDQSQALGISSRTRGARRPVVFTSRDPESRPNSLKTEQETTHFIVRWTRRASMS